MVSGIRFARPEDLEAVNALREQVNELHVRHRPDVFKEGFPGELRDYIHTVYADPDKKILVCEAEGRICAFALIHHVLRPENPYMHPREYLDIDEFCVDRAFRRKGIGTGMIRYIRDYAEREGIRRLELNMWEFNQSALKFYESVGFVTYRRYMEMRCEPEKAGEDVS